MTHRFKIATGGLLQNDGLNDGPLVHIYDVRVMRPINKDIKDKLDIAIEYQD